MGLPWEETEFDLLIDIIDENFEITRLTERLCGLQQYEK